MRQLSAILALAAAVSLGGCTVSGEFSWSGFIDIEYGAGINVDSSGNASTAQKQGVLEFQINIGDAQNATIDTVTLTQKWSTTMTAQVNSANFKDTLVANTAGSTDPYFNQSVAYGTAQQIFLERRGN